MSYRAHQKRCGVRPKREGGESQTELNRRLSAHLKKMGETPLDFRGQIAAGSKAGLQLRKGAGI